MPNYLNYEDTDKLLNIPDLTSKDGKRDALILEMLYSSGVRVSELTNIKLKDIDFQDKKNYYLRKKAINKDMYILEPNAKSY